RLVGRGRRICKLAGLLGLRKMESVSYRRGQWTHGTNRFIAVKTPSRGEHSDYTSKACRLSSVNLQGWCVREESLQWQSAILAAAVAHSDSLRHLLIYCQEPASST